MYKITKNGKTFVGCNHDAWLTTPHIWFEIGSLNSPYGAAFTGARYDGENGYAPQSGMNEYGLVFSRLSSYHPEIKNLNNKLKITNPTFYLKDILHICKTVEDVKRYIEKYDQSYFIEDVFIYIDKTGKYIIVEPYKIIEGNDASYVLSNFCPSITSKDNANRLERYKNGVAFLDNKLETNLEFCKKVSDTMHVCRDKVGDGTLLTSIWNNNDGTVNLYFYHNYEKTVQFNIKEELAKGNHILKIDTLFPKNKEFENLATYKIPHNNNSIRFFLLFSGLFFIVSSCYFLINYFRTKNRNKYNYIKLFIVPFGFLLFYYMFILNTNINIFYFSAPYYDSYNSLISMASYLPYVLLAVIIPLLVINCKVIKEKYWSKLAIAVLTTNNLLYLILIGFFIYWRFYFIF
jgi:cytochrome c oxidase subunit IV